MIDTRQVAAGGSLQPIGFLGIEHAAWPHDGFEAFIWMAARGPKPTFRRLS